MLIASDHSHTDTVLKYLQAGLSGISINIPIFLPYRTSHSKGNLPKIDSLLQYIECIREMGSTCNIETAIPEATPNNHFNDGYHSSNKVNYIP